MKISFATNRNAIPSIDSPADFGKGFSPDGLADLAFGIAEGSSTGFTLSMLGTPDQKGSAALFDALKKDMAQNGRDTLIMIHGFNVCFQDAVKGAFHFAEAYPDLNLNICLFSWPSEGGIFYKDYFDDRHNAEASGLAIARGILKLVDFLRKVENPCGQKMFLLAHSMGNWALQNALQKIKAQLPAMPRVFSKIILAAADVDADALEFPEKLGDLPKLGEDVIVYLNRGDKALFVSSSTKGNPARLGHDGPAHPNNLPGNVSAVDISAVPGFGVEGFIGHGYYSSSAEVENDLRQVIKGIAPHLVQGRNYVPYNNNFVVCLPPKS